MARTEAAAISCVALAFMALSLQGCGGGGGGGGDEKEQIDCRKEEFHVGNEGTNGRYGKVKAAKAGDKLEVTCPDGHEYEGEELECGWYDKVCPAGSQHHCAKQYGYMKKGTGLEEWPNISPVVSAKKDEEHHKLRRLKDEDKKDDDKKTTTLAPLTFNCLNGAENWQMGWSFEKADYCCREIHDHDCKVILPKTVALEDLRCVKKEDKGDDKKEEKFELAHRLNLAGSSSGLSVSAFVLAGAMTLAILGAVVAMARRSRSTEGSARETEFMEVNGESLE